MTNEGVAPPDYDTNVGLVRVLIADSDAVNIVMGIGEYLWFSDDEIEAILGLYGDNPRRTAARLLLTVAGSQALLLKKWTSDDLQVDGSAIAESLRRIAAQLNTEADNEDHGTDIFEISYPGSDNDICVPEAAPWPYICRRNCYGRCTGYC